jgi:CheY-like chemotaxis protein
MEVTDTGEGMTPEVLEHVFEPFFTTKEPGQGTGMGLAVAYSILKSHQGYILAEAAPGGGSTFRLFLPAGEEPGREVEGAIQSDLPRGRGQRVLVVDDEEKVRDYYRKALEILGYHVAHAANGGEALRLFRQAREEGRPFELALMDFAMPVMDGVQCGERLRELDTQIRLILVTGHAAEFNHEGRKPEFLNALLFKPVDLATLANQVHRALTLPDPTDGAPEVG